MTNTITELNFDEQERMRLAAHKPPQTLEYYAGRFRSGQSNIEVAGSAADPFWATDLLRRLDLILTDQDYRERFFETVDAETLASMMSFPPPETRSLEILQRMHLLPTPEIWKAAQHYDAREIFELTQADISAGGFDVSNPLHVELEYSRQKFDRSWWRYAKFLEFKRLGMLEKDIYMNERDFRETDIVAGEAAELLKFILATRNGSPMLVVGNRRYGADYFVTPIEQILADSGISVSYDHVSSTFASRYGPLECLSVDWRRIAADSPDIVIVDATTRPTKSAKTRFPEAFSAYLRTFEAYNHECATDTSHFPVNPTRPYRINLWAPVMTDEIFIGDTLYKSPMNTNDGPTVTLASASDSRVQHVHSFDDIERQAEHKVYGFTKYGFTSVPKAKNWIDYMAEIQREIRERIPKYL